LLKRSPHPGHIRSARARYLQAHSGAGKPATQAAHYPPTPPITRLNIA
jgi:hypothetical protein